MLPLPSDPIGEVPVTAPPHCSVFLSITRYPSASPSFFSFLFFSSFSFPPSLPLSPAPCHFLLALARCPSVSSQESRRSRAVRGGVALEGYGGGAAGGGGNVAPAEKEPRGPEPSGGWRTGLGPSSTSLCSCKGGRPGASPLRGVWNTANRSQCLR